MKKLSRPMNQPPSSQDYVEPRSKARFRTRPQYHRIRRILEMIREGTRTGDYPNASDFSRELEVSWITVMRDLDFLRDDEGAPIEYDASRKGFYLADETWSLPPLQLNRKEIFAFSIARKLLAGFRGTALEMDMESVFGKIAESLEGKITVDLESMTDRFTVIGEDYVVQDPETWATVARFLNRQERIKMMYEKFNGEIGNYILEPYHLFAYHGNWYVVGNRIGTSQPTPDPSEEGNSMRETAWQEESSRRRNRLATFAVSRIQSVEGTGEHFEMPKTFDPKEHIEKAFGIVRGDKVFRVRLLFSKNVSGYIKERVWHPDQRIVEKRDGCIELSFETAGWKELVRWVLSWQPDVKVLAPKRLRERVELKMRQALGLVLSCRWGM